MGKVLTSLRDMKESLEFIRGQIRLAVVPFKIDRDINTFHCLESECKNCKQEVCCINNIKNIIADAKISCDDCNKSKLSECKGIIKKNSTNSINFNTDKAKIINLINRIKVRPYIILAHDSGIGKTKDFVFGVPCYSLKENQINNENFMNELKNKKALPYYYIDGNTRGINKPSYIDLSYITPIHKNNIIKYKGYIEPEQLLEISEIVESFLDLRAFDNCDDLEILKQREFELENELSNLQKKISELSKIKNKTEK